MTFTIEQKLLMRDKLRARGLSFAQVARNIGMSRCFLSLIVNGRSKLPVAKYKVFCNEVGLVLSEMKKLNFKFKKGY